MEEQNVEENKINAAEEQSVEDVKSSNEVKIPETPKGPEGVKSNNKILILGLCLAAVAVGILPVDLLPARRAARAREAG